MGGFGDDNLDGGEGNDLITTALGKHTVHGGGGDDQIIASNDIDILYGDAGNDVINAGAADDQLDGGGKRRAACRRQ
ncbi:MAG: calcium-binding protein [Rhodoplanes sp.]